MRRRKRLRFFDLKKIEQGTEPLSPTELEVREGLAYELKEQLVSKLDLEAALQTLTPKQKAAFLLFADGHTEREIAQQLGLSRGNVHAYLEAARKKLKKILAP
ncbi:MAG: sigma-70 family RNA polymerase sigma factor [Candidatus Omnitrophota bacterium]|nr:sigma-70 family RNA polymerase sigma factor [Candidatus Omnitrophota bacterium]